MRPRRHHYTGPSVTGPVTGRGRDACGLGAGLGLAVLAAVASTAPGVAAAQVLVDAVTVPGCPDLPARIAASLGAAYERESAHVVASIVETEDGYAGEVSIELPGAVPVEQSLRDPSCEVLVDALALVVAITIDPDLLLSPGVVPEPEPVAPDVPDEAAPLALPPASPTGPLLGGLIRLGGGAVVALLPDVAPTLELATGITIDDWVRVEVSVRGALPQVIRARPDGDIGAEVGLLWGAVGLCLAPRPVAELAVGGCVALEAGAALGVGRGITEPALAPAPLWAVEGSARLEWWTGPILGFVLSIGVVVPMVRPIFTIDGLGRVYQPGPVDGTLRLGLELHLS